jgi:urate oxidase
VAFAPAGPERAVARVETTREAVVDVASGLEHFRLLRLGGSAFHGFVRDEYTTLPDMFDRPLYVWLDLEWTYLTAESAFDQGRTVARARALVREVFATFESGSIQQIIHRIGTAMLDELPAIAEIHLEANNRTWDTIAERERDIGVYTDPRPPYGCLGLRLKRNS